MYLTFGKYIELYEPIDEHLFNRLSYDAVRFVDTHTTGVDGVKKLMVAFPTEEYAAEAVRRCAAAVTNFLYMVHKAEETASMARGYTETSNGLQGKVISSVSAGNESISFSTGNQKTGVDAACADPSVRNAYILDVIRHHLSGITDANGVNLLYMGRYPL